MGRSLGLEICQKVEIKIDEIYHVASCCCPQYAPDVSRKIASASSLLCYVRKMKRTIFSKLRVHTKERGPRDGSIRMLAFLDISLPLLHDYEFLNLDTILYNQLTENSVTLNKLYEME